MSPHRVCLAVAACLVATPLATQGVGGTVEFGAYGAWTRWTTSPAATLDARIGAGGRLGIFLNRAFSLEAQGDFTETASAIGDRVRATRAGGALLYSTTLMGLYFGAGYERAFYQEGATNTDGGPMLLLGQRLNLGNRVAFRLEGRAAMHPSSGLTPASESALNLGANVGLSIMSFGGPPRDGDRDGIADRQDRCPDTPFGATVDDRGCPSDPDGDGVLAGLDACPDTPTGATVDGSGCPRDADQDGVYDGIDQCDNTALGATVNAEGCPSDSDNDGVFDGIDQCPDTPTGARVDANGCPTDQDRDGVPDGIDQCPDTPEGADVDERGCTLERDADGDGVPDSRDRCPNTREGQQVDAVGCPILFEVADADVDGDGVPDARDRCPGTAAGRQVDANGCPILFQVEQGQRHPLILRGVTFASGRSTLTPASYTTLDEVAASLVANPEVRIEIVGHTDATGSRTVNTELSLARALAVRAYLAQRDVDPTRMEARGYGPDRPIATNATAAGRNQNRRVEINLLPGANQ